jgi:hypothetical protein
MFCFKEFCVLLGGLPNKSFKNVVFDYPITLDNNNIFHIFFTYKFFINLMVEKNHLMNSNQNKFKFFFFNFF